MFIPVPWALALSGAAVMGVLIALAIAANRRGDPVAARVLPRLAYLLGGVVAGFLALAFPPALPLLAGVGGMLVIAAAQKRRLIDCGLFLIGFGAAPTLLLGSVGYNAATDPAIHAWDSTGWFIFAVVVLLAGVVLSLASRPAR